MSDFSIFLWHGFEIKQKLIVEWMTFDLLLPKFSHIWPRFPLVFGFSDASSSILEIKGLAAVAIWGAGPAMYLLLLLVLSLSHLARAGFLPPSRAVPKPPLPQPGAGASGRILGGSDAAPGEFPAHVSLHGVAILEQFVCSGTLISPTWLLTAAHCCQVHLRERCKKKKLKKKN